MGMDQGPAWGDELSPGVESLGLLWAKLSTLSLEGVATLAAEWQMHSNPSPER